MKKPVLLVISGPTGSGKTDLSIRLAQQLNCSVVSADSRQVFRELPIGSAAPEVEQLKAVPHFFIGSKSIQEPFNAGMYEQEALQILETLFQENTVQILCGGTGLYIDALIQGMDVLPAANPDIRQELNLVLENQGIGALQQELLLKDPDYYHQADIQNPQRLLRALEIIRSTGKTYSSLRKKTVAERPFETIYLATDLPREELYRNINNRVQSMLEKGWLAEAEALLPCRSLNALQTVGYKELFGYFDNTYSLEQAIELIRQNTRRYAKRQLTWLRSKEQVHWIHPTMDEQEIIRNYVHR